MEDAVVAEQVSEHVSAFAVFDGHGGEVCAEYTASELPKRIKAGLKAGLPAAAAVVTAHHATDCAWLTSSGRDDSGTTAISVLLESATGRVLAANVGDSRCVMAQVEQRRGAHGG